MLIGLDLLRVFEALHRERQVTRAARVVGLSQPAMSRALVRMRDALGDQLFVRSTRGMLPTPRAEVLAPAIRRVLEGVEALRVPGPFDPATLVRTFTVGAVDFFDTDLLPEVARTLKTAPGVSVSTRPLGADSGDNLKTGQLDLIVGVRQVIPPDAMIQHLFDEGFVCAVRRGHPVVKNKLTLAMFVELSHLLIAPRGEPGGPVDDALAKRGLARRVAVLTHTFQSAPLIVSRSDLVLTAPRRIVAPVAKAFGLRMFEPPLPVPPFGVYQAWHPRVQDDPAHTWFRRVIAASAR